MTKKIKWIRKEGFGIGPYGERLYGEYRCHGKLGKHDLFLLLFNPPSGPWVNKRWQLMSLIPDIPGGYYKTEITAKRNDNKQLTVWLNETGLQRKEE